MTKVRVIAIGDRTRADDGAALEAARRLVPKGGVEVVLAERSAPALLGLLDPAVPTVLVDVVCLGAAAGSVVELALDGVRGAVIDGRPVCSHHFGAARALALAEERGAAIPRGIFLAFGGREFTDGAAFSAEAERAIDDLVTAIEGAVEALSETL